MNVDLETILVVNANHTALTAARKTLAAAGYTTFGAQDGEKALALVRAHKPALVLLDAELPGMDGVEVCRRIKADPELNLVFVTLIQSPRLTAEVEYFDSTADDVMLSSLPGYELLGRVRSMLKIRAANKALRESEERFHLMFEKHDAIMLLIEPQSGSILDANLAAVKFYGYKKAKLCKMRIDEINVLPPEQVAAERQKALHEERNYFVFPHRLANGETRIVEVHSSPISFQEKRVLFSIIHDITERKQAEKDLLDSEDKFKYVFDHSATGKSITYPSGEINVNQAFCELLGYSAEELRSRKWQEITHPDDLELTQNKINTLLSGEKQAVRFTKRFIHKNGSIVWVDLGSTLRRDQNGKPLYMMTTLNDITALKQAEQALRESEGSVRAKLDAILMPEGDIGTLELADVLDIQALQSMMDGFFRLTKIGIGIIDMKGHVLVATGWQDICTKFHRVHPETCQYCIESDNILTEGVTPGSIKMYRCKNNMWDIATPITLGDRHVGNLFLGQFLFTDEQPDHEAFRAQARQYGFDEQEYLAALDRLPRWSRETVDAVMSFYMELAEMISTLSYRNITLARSLAERESLTTSLQESQAQLQAVMDYSPALISIKDLNGNILLANRSFSELDAPPLHEMIGKNVFDLFPREVAEKLWNNDLAALKAKGPVRSEEVVKHKDGTWHTYLTVKFPVFLKSDQPYGICAISNDITERKQMEEKLKESLALLRIAGETVKLGAWSVDLEANSVLWSDEVAAIHETPPGFSPTVANGISFYAPEWRGKITRVFNDCTKKGIRYDEEMEIITTTGKRVAVQTTGEAVRDDQGRIIKVHGAFQDISKRKQAEQILRETSERLAHMLANSPTVLYALKADGDETKPFWISDNIESILGFSAQEGLQPEWWPQQIHPEDRPQALAALEHLCDDLYQHEYRFRRKDGRLIWVHDEHRLLRNAENKLWEIIGSWTDITERKQAEQTLKEYNSRLESAVEARTHELRDTQEQLVRQEKLAVLGQLAGGVGHELRNPLAVILNAVYYLKLVQPDANENVKEYLGILERETHNAEKIITDLLDFSRAKSADREPVVVSELVDRTLKRFPAPPSVQVTLNIPADLPQIYADARQMEQVLGNLVLNACQAMPEGGKLTLSAKLKNKMIAIAVKDTGAGIPPENMQKLFQPLFTTKSKGIGLGLAVSQKLVEANGGKLEVQSKPGKGATFTLFLAVSKETK
jgi:PAS domain S-box-containing protein